MQLGDTLSLPFALRYRLAYDAPLFRDVLHIFVQAIFSSLRRRAGFPSANRQVRVRRRDFRAALWRRLES